SLTEALCGFQFILTHLDNRQLLIKSQPGEVVKPGIYLSFLISVSMLCVFVVCIAILSGASMKCAGCQGSGMKVSIRHLGPSMIQQMQHPCNECKGTGETINDKDRCTQCKGEKVVQEKKVLEVHVEKGMQNGQKITFPGEADEAPDTVTGDIVFVLQQKEHPKFKRKGDDIFVEHTLSLTEALCGFQFILTHLDNRQLLIKSQPGEVVKPGIYLSFLISVSMLCVFVVCIAILV
nr:DnaJ protein homolog [Tanacetum cinerariifolium]